MAESNFITKMLKQAKEPTKDPNKDDDYDEEAYKKALEGEQGFASGKTDECEHHKQWDFIISFNSVNRIRFEFITCLLVLYDCIMLPFDIAFDI